MRRSLIVPVLLILTASAAAESRLFLSAGAGFLRPGDSAYRSVYGGQTVFPEFSASGRVVAGLCLTAGYGQFSRTGTTPELGLTAHATQSYFTYGLSYLLRLSPTICLRAGGGLASLRFREEALDMEVRGRHSGVMAEGGVWMVPEDERVFMGLTVGYLSGRVAGQDLQPALDRSIRLGGLKVAVSIGIQLFGSE